MLNKDDQKIDFGYKAVKISEKQKLVNNVFDSVASKYDLMNDLTSFGIHRLWKNDLINWLAPQNNQRLADIAGGTGDIAKKFLDAGGESAHVYDINIPATEGSFERATIGFGLRNITDRVKCLKEIYRILKPGGRLICLEFSHVENNTIRKLYDTWSFNFMPSIGKQIAGDKDAYTYLVESIRQFPTQPELAQMFSEVGFSRVKYRNLSNGIVALHSGWKI